MVCGSAPVSSQSPGDKDQDVTESEEVDEWIQIRYVSSAAKGSSSVGGDDTYRTKIRKANIEISLSSKDQMNEWIDAILNQSEVISSQKH
jgi:mannitol-specific phosphotransferase system IIBC component